jgi:aspartate aminotransferase-like enzyme
MSNLIEDKLNFTVGPVMSSDEVKEIGNCNTPYFRTPEFSAVMLENERMIKEMAGADDTAKVVFITGSGTASMEAVIMNTLTSQDKALVVKGGSFGARFSQLCEIHEIPHTDIVLESGKALHKEDLVPYEGKDYTAFIVNLGETSTGVLYDLALISDFCRRNGLFLIVDAISAFLADPIDMKGSGIDVMITGSQKALAVPPGISVIILAEKALERVSSTPCKCMYLDLKDALHNMERGQTPFTPAVTILLQINQRLRQIEENGGAKSENERIAELAGDFRAKIADMPFDLYAETPSNAVTALKSRNHSAKEIFRLLKDEYGIWICPNGGDLADEVFRVGHLGNLTIEDNDTLIKALNDLKAREVF